MSAFICFSLTFKSVAIRRKALSIKYAMSSIDGIPNHYDYLQIKFASGATSSEGMNYTHTLMLTV